MEFSYRKLDKKKQGKQMFASNLNVDDVTQVKILIRAIGGGGRVNDFIYSTFKVMSRLFPHEGDPRKQWTERRLKAWWNQETDVVRHWQMMELFEAAEAAKDERKLLKAARRDHAEYIAKTTRIRALAELVAKDEARGMAER
ncbi:hypothetical protein [Rhizobium hidalgonense]|uniref:hypothetical protein n=1 Tax=Rhizobium hidalgonense TaxID=1538159 RepID=UPI0028726DFC|nr:hypothetical protein [Rhizobium hidalgonense]MDR9813086.1 hypothetical protein [Rhizobium hidalgonense]